MSNLREFSTKRNLTTEDDDQALARMHEKGADAARVAVEMANLTLALEGWQNH